MCNHLYCSNSEYPVATFARFQVERHVASMCELANGHLVTMDISGVVRVWQVQATELYNAAQTWRQMVGVDQKVLSIIYETDKVSMQDRFWNEKSAYVSTQDQEDKTDMMVGDSKDRLTGQGDSGQGRQCNGGDGVGSGGRQGTGDGEGGAGEGQGASGGGFNGVGGRMNEGGREEATFEDINNLKLVSIICMFMYARG